MLHRCLGRKFAQLFIAWPEQYHPIARYDARFKPGPVGAQNISFNIFCYSNFKPVK